jgi:hypothetical protein
MTESMKLSSKTEAAPLLESEGTGTNGALQLLADRYAKRLARIRAKVPKCKHDPTPYYKRAEIAVRALYADAT